MTSPTKNKQVSLVSEKIQSLRRGSLKTLFYIVLLAVLLSVLGFIFGWTSTETVPPLLQPFSSIIILVNPYLVYIQTVLVFVLGYLVVNTVGGMVYTYMRRVTDHPTAATIRTVTRVSGIVVLLSMTASVLNVNPAAALTVGSFGDLVVGARETQVPITPILEICSSRKL